MRAGLVRRGGRAAAVLAALALTATPARAHLVQSGFGAFYDGIAHLFLTPSDLLLALGIGLLAGSRGASVSRTVLLAVPAAWLAGGLLGPAFPAAGSLSWGTTISFSVVGALVAANARLPRAPVVALGCAAGALHGFAGGATIGGGAWPSLAGAALAIFVLVTLLAALVVSLRAPAGRIAVRVAGSWIAASGLLMLGWLARARG